MTFRHFIFVSMGLLALFTPPAARACSVCGCGDPLESAGTAHPLANSFRLTLESSYLTATAQSDGDGTQSESVRQVNLNTTLSYSPTDNLSLTALLPLVEKYWALSAGDASPDEGTPFGVGDMMIGARYFFISDTDLKIKQHLGVALSGGAYLPTGGTNFTSLITGDSLDTHSQLGTGAVGFYTGLLLNRAWEGFTLSVNANLLVRTTPTTSDPDSPVYKYTYGNAFTGGIQGQWDLSDYWAASLAVEGRYADADTADEGGAIAPVGNTGGTVIDLTPGLSWNVTGDAALYAKVQVPFLTGLNGVQRVDPTYILGTQFLIR